MRARLVFLTVLVILLSNLPLDSLAATKAQIDKAIEKGVKHLQSLQQQDGSWQYPGHNEGVTALAGLALLESGVLPNNPAIMKGADYCRAHGSQCTNTYSLALLIFFFDRLGKKEDLPLIVALGERLRGGQSKDGMWSYSCSASPGGGFPGGFPMLGFGGGDNSNTQFAVMGLWVARRHGVDVKEALVKVDQHFRRSQSSDGGWSYIALGSLPQGRMNGLGISSGSMTCAGLLGLLVHLGSQGELRAVSRDDLKAVAKPAAPAALEPLKDPAVQAALKRLEQHMSGNNPLADMGLGQELYFLWSVERVGAAYGLKNIGAVDWYEAGCDRLLPKQTADGGWNDYSPEVGTSLALLFLKRANLAADLTRMVQAGDSNATLKAGVGLPDAARAPAKRKAFDKQSPVAFTSASLAAKSPSELAALLAGAKLDDQRRVLQELHDRKGAEATVALAEAVDAVDGSLQSKARELLAARLQRMTANTLLQYIASENLEIQQGAVTAASLKKDKSFAGGLIELLESPNAKLADSAHEALVICTGQNFGPFVGGGPAERFVIVKKWKAWREQQK